MTISKNVTVFAPEAGLADIASDIRGLRKRTCENIVEIGRLLSKARDQIEHGCWLEWLATEFDWGKSTANSFIQVYEANFKRPIIGSLDPTALYLLARPSTPTRARAAVEKLVYDGKRPSVRGVRELIRKFTPEGTLEFSTPFGPKAVQAGIEHHQEKRGARNAERGDSPEVIWSRGLMNRADESADMARYEDWSTFKVTSRHVIAASKAASAWTEVAAYLQRLVPSSGRERPTFDNPVYQEWIRADAKTRLQFVRQLNDTLATMVT